MNSPGRGDQTDYGNFFSSPFPDTQKISDYSKQKPLVINEEPTTPIDRFPNEQKPAPPELTTINEISSSNSEIKSQVNEASPAEENQGQPFFGEKQDRMLIDSVKLHGKNWKKIKKAMNQAEYTPDVLKKRFDQLRSDEFKPGRKFSHQEDLLLAKCYNKYGTKWVEMVKYFEFRDASMLKNRFYSHVKSKLDNLTHEGESFEVNEKEKEEEAPAKERYEPTDWREIIDYSDHIPNAPKGNQPSKEEQQKKKDSSLDNKALLKYVQQLESKISNLENQININQKNTK